MLQVQGGDSFRAKAPEIVTALHSEVSIISFVYEFNCAALQVLLITPVDIKDFEVINESV